MLGFLEPICREYCSPSYYNWLGQYFWPNLLNNGYSLVEFFTELDTTGVIATGTALLATAGGLYYCISRRNGEVHVEKSVEPFQVETLTINVEEAKRLQQQRERQVEQHDAARLEAAQKKLAQEAVAQGSLAQETHTEVAVRNAHRVEIPTTLSGQAPAVSSVASVVAPRQHMPKQQILGAYFKTHLSEKMRYLHPGEKPKVEEEVFTALGLPLDGMIPTEPVALGKYRSTMKGLGLNLNY